MKYNCKIINGTKAAIEIIPENSQERAVCIKMEENNMDEDTLHYYYSKALEMCIKSAVLLRIDGFQEFPTKAKVSYDTVTGLGS